MNARIGSLFSGYGGLDIAVEEVLGARTVWHAEVEQAPSRILAARWPGVPNLGDVTTVDWAAVEPVDVICGGSPCQDVSSAGKRAGMRAGTRSGLWAAMCDAIDIIRPALVVWENVCGVLSAEADSALEPCPGCVGDPDDGAVLRALGRVLGDLADIGYDTQWCGLRAADVGAPHGRFRIFVAAYPTRVGRDERRPESTRLERGSDAPQRGHAVAPDTDRDGRESLRRVHTVRRDPDRRDSQDTTWGVYEPAIRRWEHVLGRVAPAPTELAPKGGQRLSARAVEFMMGLPDGWVTDVPGVSRNDQLRMLGNGCVPQQAAAALRHMLNLAECAS